MKNPTVLVCAVPPACWDGDTEFDGPADALRPLLRELATLERRILKGANLDEERARYAGLCADLEGVALELAVPGADRRAFRAALHAGRFPATRVGPAYFDMLDALARSGRPVGFRDEHRVGGSTVPPAALAAHCGAFRDAARASGFGDEPAVRERYRFAARAAQAGCGLVEIAEPLDDAEPLPRVNGVPVPKVARWTAMRNRIRAALRRYTLLEWASRQFAATGRPPIAPPRADWMLYGTKEGDNRGDFMKQRLRSQIEQALAGAGSVNMSGQQRHETATEVLQEYVVRAPGSRPGTARILYADGSEAAPFPLRCVAPPRGAAWVATRELHVALISMRHLQLDRHIDINWFRNASVPANKTMADADEFCFRASLAQLAEVKALYAGERLLMHLYHTGFEPAVIGFYRALVTLLTDTATWNDRLFGRPSTTDWVRVVPRFNRPHGFVAAERWPH